MKSRQTKAISITFWLSTLLSFSYIAPSQAAQTEDDTIQNCHLGTPIDPASHGLALDSIQLPAGFKIDVYANNVEGARSMALSNDGVLFVGSRHPGKVYAVLDCDNNKQADRVVTIARNLNSPNGVALRAGALFVAENNRILKYENIKLNKIPSPVVINEDLPSQSEHGWKYISFGPDGLLYVPVGAPCNSCEKTNKAYAAIHRMQPDGKKMELFARGVRNTVGFDWHPVTKELWFTDNGRDMLGNNRPPDELNHAPRPGLHFGFPYCHGKDISDPTHGQGHNCSTFNPPAVELGPHVAALGMRFYTGKMFPTSYQNQIFIAEHGSWNRSPPIGYRITLVHFEKTRAVYEVFAQGWLQEGTAWGRPVAVVVHSDGSLLVSDDYADVIYRISYQAQ